MPPDSANYQGATAGAAIQIQLHSSTSSGRKGRGKMSKFEFNSELENIYFKYERLTSLIGILQMFVAEVVDVAGAPAGSLTNALFEIELEMDKTNEKLKSLLNQKGGAA